MADSCDPSLNNLLMIAPSWKPPKNKETDEIGAHILAMLQGTEKREGPASVGGMAHRRICYDREYLFRCSDLPVCRKMPQGLDPILMELPMLRPRNTGGNDIPHFQTLDVSGQRKKKSGIHGSNVPYFQIVHQDPRIGSEYRRPLGQIQSNIVDQLPLRFSANSFFYNSAINQWIPRARPAQCRL